MDVDDTRDRPDLLADVGPLFRGRSLAIELGPGNVDELLGLAGAFARVRGVDADPKVAEELEERAAKAGLGNMKGFAIEQPWDEPTGAADYVYSPDLFRQVEDWVEAANYLQRISMALRSGGIAQLRFDTRRVNLAHRLRRRIPNRWRPADERRGMQSVRRLETWVRDRVRNADLEIIGERGAGTADHWVVARRR
jgi:trans-aconitate methyltransferase